MRTQQVRESESPESSHRVGNAFQPVGVRLRRMRNVCGLTSHPANTRLTGHGVTLCCPVMPKQEVKGPGDRMGGRDLSACHPALASQQLFSCRPPERTEGQGRTRPEPSARSRLMHGAPQQELRRLGVPSDRFRRTHG